MSKQNRRETKPAKQARKTNNKKNKSAGSVYIKKHKIVVFVPLKNTLELISAMASAGAGIIGNYTVCSFRQKGVGTFFGGKDSNPRAGIKGRLEQVEEIRLEMVCEEKFLDRAIDKIYEVHPYEEPAYEIYDIKVRARKQQSRINKIK